MRGYDQLNENGKYRVKAVVAKYIKQVNKDSSNNRKKEVGDIVKESHNEFEKDSIEKVSLTDKESRFMKNKKGVFELAYNAQMKESN